MKPMNRRHDEKGTALTTGAVLLVTVFTLIRAFAPHLGHGCG